MAAKRRVDNLETPTGCLLAAALSREHANATPWDHGWAFSDYRRSTRAALTQSPGVFVRLPEEGLAQFEAGAEALLRLPEIKNNYDGEEFWYILATLVGPLPLDQEDAALERMIRAALERLIDPPLSIVVFPVANCACDTPVPMGNCLVGSATLEWVDLLQRAARFEWTDDVAGTAWWAASLRASKHHVQEGASRVVLFGRWGREQGLLAMRRADEAFNDLVSVVLVLEPDLNQRGLFSLRGDRNKPGMRGFQVDRSALEVATRSATVLRSELGAEVLVSGVSGPNLMRYWSGAAVFPLGDLLAQTENHQTIERVISPRHAVDHRLRTAARWHSKAHWASARDDAVLALGIAFDALLSESGPGPGRVLGERFALLSKDKTERPQAYRHFMQDIYAARNAVAHGGKSSKHSTEFVRSISAELRAAFRAINDLTSSHGVESEDGYAELFDHLKWDIPYIPSHPTNHRA